MPNPVTDLPDEFVAASAASLPSRRQKLTRRLRTQKMLVHIVFGLSACEALCPSGLSERRLLSDQILCGHRVHRFRLCIYRASSGSKKAVDALREKDRST